MPRLAVRLRLMLAVRLPSATLWLVVTGAWTPQRGSAPMVLESVVPSGSVVVSEYPPLCNVFFTDACNPLGQVLVSCSGRNHPVETWYVLVRPNAVVVATLKPEVESVRVRVVEPLAGSESFINRPSLS